MTRHDLAQRLAGCTLALRASHVAVLAQMLRGAEAPPPAALYTAGGDPPAEDLGLEVTGGGVAIVPVRGCLVKDAPWWSSCTSYDGLRARLSAALELDQVKAVALLVDSPGGDVAGCFDLVDTVYAMRGSKPLWAILDEGAYSAAYALASACDRIVVPRTGGTGSIGVIYMHVDLSAALEKAGIGVTLIRYGARKAEGSPFHPLSDEALERAQADVDAMGELFVDTVARNRGLAASAVRAMEAGTFLGAAGVTAGLADAVMTPDAAFLELLGLVG